MPELFADAIPALGPGDPDWRRGGFGLSRRTVPAAATRLDEDATGKVSRLAKQAMQQSTRRLSLRPAGAIVLALLGGCVFDRREPDVSLPAVPARYDQAGKLAAPPPRPDWAREFRSAELTKLVEAAAIGNLDVAAAAARIVQAEAQAEVDAAALYPTLNGTGGASHSRTPGTARSSRGPFRSSTGENFNLGLTASYALDFWGRNRDVARAGDLAAVATRYDRETVVLSTTASTASAYLTLLAAQDRLRIVRENIGTAAKVLEAEKARLAVGTATALDVAQQESLLASQRANLPALELQVQQNRNLLAVLLGRTPESLFVRGGGLSTLAIPVVRPGLPSQLLRRRPDIASAEATLASQDASVDAARKAFLPDFQLTAQGGFESVVLKNLLRPDAIAASVAGSVLQPLFTGFQLEGQLKLAEGRYREQLETYRKTVIQALADVENALVALRQYARQERSQAEVVAAARRAYQITEQRLREGTIDIVTLLNIQQTLFQAQDQLVQVRLLHLQAAVSLFQALGGGWSLPEKTAGAAEEVTP